MGTAKMETKPEEKALLDNPASPRKTGGLITMPFIIVNESFERLASTALMPNMIFYLMRDYHMEAVTATSILSVWSALSNGLAIFGAFLSDSYLGRFRVIAIGSISSFLGMVVLWSTAAIPQLKPPPCNQLDKSCSDPTAIQVAQLLFSFVLIATGAGCVRPCSMAFGADQLANKENPNNERVLESFFNWYYASTGISTVLAMTVIVYIQENMGWTVGFGIPAVLMACSILMLLLGSSLYIKVKASESLLTGFFQVTVAAFRKRKINLPFNNYDACYYQNPESKLLEPTDSLRCLNRACIIQDPDRDINPDGSTSNPWRLCSVEQVESLKALLKIIPMWSTSFLVLMIITQNFSTLQAATMNRHIGNFEIPAGSFTLFMVVTLTIWVAFYDRVLVPLVSRYTGQPRGLSPIVRMGVGIVMASIAMGLSLIVESIRRQRAIEEGIKDDPNAIVDMSAFWLVPQLALCGLAEAFNAIGQIEFFYSLIPKSMSSIAVAVYTLGMAIAGLLGGLLVNIVNSTTSQGGNTSWLASNINQGHLDYYYGLLGFINIINFIYFLFCCRFFTS